MRSPPLPHGRHQHPRRWFRALLAGLLIISFALIWRFLTTSSWLTIRDVQVQGDPRGFVTQGIRQDLLGQNILTVKDPDPTKLASGSAVLKITLAKSFPSSITATVTFRTPRYSWQTSRGRYLVDSSGLAYQNAGSEQLPEVTDLTSSTGLGEKVEASKLALLSLLSDATAGTYTVLTATFSGSDLAATLASGSVVYVSGGGDTSQIRSALQAILAKAKIDGRLPKTIDLRYQKPVVTF